MERQESSENSLLNRFLNTIEKTSELTGKAVSFLIILILIVSLVLIIFRRLLPYTGITIWTAEDEELPTFSILLTVYFTLGAGYALHTHSFINYDILPSALSPKTKAWINLATYFLFFFTFGALFWLLAGDLFSSLSEGIGAVEGPGTPTTLMKIEAYLQLLMLISWPVGVFLLLLEGVSESILTFRRAAGRGNPSAH